MDTGSAVSIPSDPPHTNQHDHSRQHTPATTRHADTHTHTPNTDTLNTRTPPPPKHHTQHQHHTPSHRHNKTQPATKPKRNRQPSKAQSPPRPQNPNQQPTTPQRQNNHPHQNQKYQHTGSFGSAEKKGEEKEERKKKKRRGEGRGERGLEANRATRRLSDVEPARRRAARGKRAEARPACTVTAHTVGILRLWARVAPPVLPGCAGCRVRLAELLGAAGRAAGEPAAERRPRLRCDFARSKSMKERAFQLQTHLCRSVEARVQRHITARETIYVALNDAKLQPASLVSYCCGLFACAARAAHSLGRVVEVVWRENGPFRDRRSNN